MLPDLKAKIPFRLAIAMAALGLSECGALSTHQPARLMEPGTRGWSAGLGLGPRRPCPDSGALGNGCVLTLDPYLGYRWSGPWPQQDRNLLPPRSEMGIKLSGVPFLGGTLLVDARVQAQEEGGFYRTWDFGAHVFPCLTNNMFDDEYDGEKTCEDRPFGGGVYVGATVGTEWMFLGAKYGVGGTSWDGWQFLPGIFAGLSLGSRTFKVIPSVDVYFYQWPYRFRPDYRVLAGIGFQYSQ